MTPIIPPTPTLAAPGIPIWIRVFNGFLALYGTLAGLFGFLAVGKSAFDGVNLGIQDQWFVTNSWASLLLALGITAFFTLRKRHPALLVPVLMFTVFWFAQGMVIAIADPSTGADKWVSLGFSVVMSGLSIAALRQLRNLILR